MEWNTRAAREAAALATAAACVHAVVRETESGRELVIVLRMMEREVGGSFATLHGDDGNDDDNDARSTRRTRHSSHIHEPYYSTVQPVAPPALLSPRGYSLQYLYPFISPSRRAEQ